MQSALAVSREGEAGADIFAREIRKITENLVFGHTGGEILEDVVNRNPHAADTGFTSPLMRFDRYDVPVVHNAVLRTSSGKAIEPVAVSFRFYHEGL